MSIRRTGLSALLLATLCATVAPIARGAADHVVKSWDPDAGARAQDPSNGPWRPPPPRTAYEEERATQARSLRHRVQRYFEKATKLEVSQDYKKAQKLLARLSPRRLKPYERAVLFRMQAYIAYGLGDRDSIVPLLRKAIDQDVLSRSDTADVLFQIAQVQTVMKQWPQVVDTMKYWFQTETEPGSSGYYQLALAYYEEKNLDDAVAPAQKAVDLAKVPQQSWLQLLLAIQLARKDYAAATPVLVALLTHYPNAGTSYWTQLSSLYGIQHDIPRALAVLELGRRMGAVTEDQDLRRIAELSQSQDMPIRAVNVLQDGLSKKQIQPDVAAFELLANSWILARESKKGEEALARAAALAPKGDLYLRLAEVMMQNEQWEQAAAALKSATEKGGLDDPRRADLLLGIAYFKANHLVDARRYFARAREGAKTRASADAWIEQVDHQLQTPTEQSHPTSLG